MPRPQCCRRVSHAPTCAVFVPAGVPACDIEEIVLSLDECEAIRLADLEGLYHEEAASRMNVSRQTFGRILETGRNKVAQVLVEGKALRIGGGEVEMSTGQTFRCPNCRRSRTMPPDGSPLQGCPKCKSINILPQRSGCPSTDEHPDKTEHASKGCCHRHGRSK